MSDTPRTDDAYFNRPDPSRYDLAGEMKIMERELNAANAEIERLTNKAAQLYEGAEEQKQRIKRLEEAGDEILNANNDDEEYEAIKRWSKAKEAKP